MRIPPSFHALGAPLALLLSGCFTIIDFDENGSGGASTSTLAGPTSGPGMGGGGGTTTTATSTGTGMECGGADLATHPENCGTCGRSCEGGACEGGVCQGALAQTAASNITALAESDDRYAYLAVGELCIKEQPSGVGNCSPLGPVIGNSNPQFFGSVALSDAGLAYLSLQSDTPTPLRRCDGVNPCEGWSSLLTGSHVNGLIIYNDTLFVAHPGYGTVMAASLANGTVSEQASLNGAILAHTIRFGGTKALVTNYDPPCLATPPIGQLTDATSQLLTCSPISAPPNHLITGGVMTADDRWFVRAEDTGSATSHIYTESGEVFGGLLLDRRNGAMEGDATHLYFFGTTVGGNRLMRCPNSMVAQEAECVPISPILTGAPGVIVVSDAYVFYSVEKQIFRAVK